MRIEQFEYLIDIAETKSITKTAENLFISRQVISHSIRAMEKELGVQLLNREHGSVTLTPIGEIAVDNAKKIIIAYHNFQKDIIGITTSAPSNPQASETAKIQLFTIPRLYPLLLSVIKIYRKQFSIQK